jgi:hypothetical protein
MQIENRGRSANVNEILARVRQAVDEVGLRAVAAEAGVSASQLSRVLAGERTCTWAVLSKLAITLSGTFRVPPA